ncbi:MAG: transglutaminase-like domain-containing protein [Lachnospiraceae bacterium]|nr:transglutaminase-like domain-containing protein [Lachnospiraceae bacterium]
MKPLYLAWSLSAALTAIVMSLYGDFLAFTSLPAVMVVCTLCFLLCRFVDRHRLLGTLLLIPSFFLLGFLLRLFLTAGSQQTGMGFREWMLTRGEDAGFSIMYVCGLILGAGFFFSITVYYFTMVQYRISFLALLGLMPCVLYAKVIADIDNVCLLIIAALEILLHISVRRAPIKGLKPFSFLGAPLCFVFMVLLLSAAIPKENDARYYDRFETLFLGETGADTPDEDYSHLSDYSGNADFFSEMTSRRLYNIQGTSGRYYKRQNFDLYDFDQDRWAPAPGWNEPVTPINDWRSTHLSLSFSSLQEAMRHAERLEPGFAEKYGLEGLINGPDLVDPVTSTRIQPIGFTPAYYLASPSSIAVFSTDAESILASPSGTYQNKGGAKPDLPYYAGYSETFFHRQASLPGWIQTGIADMPMDISDDMLSDLYQILHRHHSRLDLTAKAFADQQSDAGQYRKDMEENTACISQKLQELALGLTGECRSDREKAAALLNYFEEGDFIYDVEYKPRDTSPEYFLFTSRRGSCSDYASAYVLLARAAGLTVRYAEGFLAEGTSWEDFYVIRNTGAHAWPEVYLPNTGWVNVEPTVGREETKHFSDELGRHLLKLLPDGSLVRLVIFAGFLIGLLFVLLRLLLPLAAELIFRIRICFAPLDACAILIYRHLLKKAENKGLHNPQAMTPREFADALMEMQRPSDRDTAPELGLLSHILELILYAPAPDISSLPDRKTLIRLYQAGAKALRK